MATSEKVEHGQSTQDASLVIPQGTSTNDASPSKEPSGFKSFLVRMALQQRLVYGLLISTATPEMFPIRFPNDISSPIDRNTRSHCIWCRPGHGQCRHGAIYHSSRRCLGFRHI